MNEFDLKLGENMMSKLLLGGEVKINLADRDGSYKLEDLTSMTSRVVGVQGVKLKRFFVLFCTVSKGNSQYMARIELTGVQDEIWYVGKIIFPRAPV